MDLQQLRIAALRRCIREATIAMAWPVSDRPRLYFGVTVTSTRSFAGCRSTCPAGSAAVALFTTGSREVSATTAIAIVACAPTPSAPRSQVTIASLVQVPLDVVTPAKPTPAGSGSENVTSPAVANGPLFLTWNVYT